MRIALYDLDKTLTRAATFTPFLMFAARRIAPWRLVFAPVWVAMMIGYRAGLYDRTTLKTRGMRLMLGRASLAQVEEAGRAFASARIAGSGFMPGTLRLLEEDRSAGAHVAIATAAFEFYARAFADHLGIAHVIGTRWDGRTIPGGNCYGAAKLARVAAWAREEGLSLEDSSVRFVSDSFADGPLLDRADEAIFVTASARAADRARARGWDARDLGI